ncbi:MAG: hypothetical protein M3A44_15005 [Gammaproteobacteria bacterium]
MSWVASTQGRCSDFIVGVPLNLTLAIMTFDFAKLLEKHPVGDLLYRLVLWAGIAFLFYYLASLANENGGQYVSDAVRGGNKGEYWNVLGSFGLIFWIVGCFSKNISLKLPENRNLSSAGFAVTSVLTKLATDILLAAFGLGASFLGYLGYYIQFEHPASAPIRINLFIGFGFTAMLVLIALLGFRVIVLKAKPDSAMSRLAISSRKVTTHPRLC